MKPLLTLFLVGFLCSNLPARPAGQTRTLQDIKVIAPEVLQRSVSPKFFKSLLISPIEGWIVVRGNVINTHISGATVMRSELNGAYDQLALDFAKDLHISGFYALENPLCGGSVLMHLLVYKTADGTMVLSFPTFNEPGGNQVFYWGCARLAVLKSEGKWVEIEGPEGLHGHGWAVRPADRTRVPGHMRCDNAKGFRLKKYRPKPALPPSSALAPIIASTKR